jgi:imidazolonepropionase-like amidohydrolase
VALGTDAGSPGVLHGEAVVEELKLLIRAGFSLTEAVRCATVNGADLLGLDRGRIAVGSRADFLVARGTPAQLPRKFSYLEAIWLSGRPSPIYQKNPQRSER